MSDFSALNLDQTQLKAIERLLNEVELLINNEPTDAVNLLYKLKNEIVQLKGQKKKPDTNIIHVSASDLRKAFNAHWSVVKAQQKKGISCHLLIFYAVECGLKSIWLKRNNLTGTDRIDDQTLLTKDGHNFRIWIKELRLPATIAGMHPDCDKIPSFRLARDKSSWDVGKAHQAWRYGVQMDAVDENDLIEWLESICTWIQDNIDGK
jgi:hypothetical protein